MCLSLLVLPWAVFLFVGEIDRNLRDDQLEQTHETVSLAAEEVAAIIGSINPRVRPESKTLLAGRLNTEMLVDGYADDWSTFEMLPRQFRYSMNKLSVDEVDQQAASSFLMRAAVWQGDLYLFLKVTDQQIVYSNSLSNRRVDADQIVIRVLDDNADIRRYTFQWSAPGAEFGQYFDDAVEGVRPLRVANEYIASMAETDDGYDVELRIPLPEDGKFGLAVIDVDAAGDGHRWTGMFDPDEPDDVGQLQVIDQAMNTLLDPYTEPGMRMRVFNGQGWLLADSDKRVPDATLREFIPAENNVFDAVLYRFIAWSLAKNVDTRRLPEIDNGKLGIQEFQLFEELTERPEFLKDLYQRIFYSTVTRVEKDNDLHGYLFVQMPRASLTAFTETAMLRLVKIFGLSVLLIAAALIGFASLLSWRVRKLRDAVEQSVTGDGVIVQAVKQSDAPDEIGDLSRSFSTIIGRLDGYTRYLQSLGSRLSHELRTPLSVVSTSLEGIDKHQLDDKTRSSVERAELGAERLQRLIRNLPEASSVEQTIERSSKERLDLVAWVHVAQEVYASLYQDRKVILHTELSQAPVSASAELLHQMLDKLMSNAVDFSAPGSTILLRLIATGSHYDLLVENAGSRLPMSKDLFAPMVSIRESRDDQPHMGFGLHIVKLVADFHHASCQAWNVEGRDSVCISVSFPRLDAV